MDSEAHQGETRQFEAEVSKLLDLVINSLYTNKEIFLRELVSNASDACDKLRHAALTQPELTAGDSEFRIEIVPDQAAGTLSIIDNGIGMNREDLVSNLGTIARSGTAAFVEQMNADKDKSGDMALIGRFGVGFYSAFMVAEQVTVSTRRAGEAEAWEWQSEGRGSFTIAQGERAGRGTTVTLKMREDAKEFLEPFRLRSIIRKYSDHIAVPIKIKEGDKLETVNQASALWMRPKSEITSEQYTEFYHHVAHAFDDPWLTIHNRAEGTIEYTNLLFVPSTKPFDLFDPERKHQVKLYVRRVFVTDNCPDLMPTWLRFVRGVVDSEDLPLNVSRETLQHNPILARIRQAVVKRVLGEIEKKAEKAPEEYATFWENFGAVLKEGLYEGGENRDALLKLARFHSTTDEGGLVSLTDYVGRMKEGQSEIYYIAGDSIAALRRSPQIEGFVKRGLEVLLMTDPVDEFWLQTVHEFEDKAFRSVTRGGVDLGKFKAEEKEGEDEKSAEEAPAAADIDKLVAAFKATLGDTVQDVRVSQRLTESPVCLVADDSGMDLHIERILKQHNQIGDLSKRVLEINPDNGLIRALAGRAAENAADPLFETAAQLLLDQARILEGEPLPDPGAFSRRMTELMAKGIAAAA